MVKDSSITFFVANLLYNCEAHKNKGTLRTIVGNDLNKNSHVFTEADLDPVIKAKVSSIKKLT